MAKILIVDDDKQITDLVSKILLVEGHEPTSLNDSTKTMELAGSLTPDLFVLDLMMPEPNGFELCRYLRANTTFKNTPIVIITAMDDSDSKAIAYVAGANDYITKPFNPSDLAKRVKVLLDKNK